LDSVSRARLTPEEFLQRAITEAIANQQWSRASRLRWKLFLLRESQRASCTPQEFFGTHPPVTADWLASHYPLMFGHIDDSHAAFQRMHVQLDALETKGTANA
jgi:hypothetical protein